MLDQFRTARLGQLADHLEAFGLFRCDLHLDQFVRVQGAGQLFQHRWPHPVLAHPDHWLEVVCEALEVADLFV